MLSNNITPVSDSIPLKVRLSLWVTVILWASALVGIRIGLHDYSPGSLGLLRYLIASFSLLFLYLRLPVRHLPNLKDFIEIFIIGGLGIGVYNIALNHGEITVPAGTAGFVIGLMPVFSMCFAIILLKEKVPLSIWLGVLVSMTGLLLIAMGGQNQMSFNIGLLYVLLASIVGSYYAVAQKRLFQRYHPLELAILTIWCGTAVMLFYFPRMTHEIVHASWKTTAAIVYLGIFPAAIAYSLWNYAIDRMPAGRASGYLYAMPLIATFLGIIFLQEYPSPADLTGGLITLLGAGMINYFYNKAD